ncbi:RNA-directed DNA polymerase [Tanacetum coccineum]
MDECHLFTWTPSWLSRPSSSNMPVLVTPTPSTRRSSSSHWPLYSLRNATPKVDPGTKDDEIVGLTLMRDIQNIAIDFIPGATIPIQKHEIVIEPEEFAEVYIHCGFFQGQAKLKPRHAKWVEMLQNFSFVIRHKAGSANTVADALSRRPVLTTTSTVHVEGFENLKLLYVDDPDFKDLWIKCNTTPFRDYVRRDGFLFKGRRLCVPLSSVREAIILEAHQGGLAGHFGRDKTVAMVSERFFWPKLVLRCRRDGKVLSVCSHLCLGKDSHTNQGSLHSVPTQIGPWGGTFSIDFVLGFTFDNNAKKIGFHYGLFLSDRAFKFVSSSGALKEALRRQLCNLVPLIHPQTDGTNRIRINRSHIRLDGRSPFLVVYGRNPFTPLDLAPLPAVDSYSVEGEAQATQIKALHEQVRDQITKHNLQ